MLTKKVLNAGVLSLCSITAKIFINFSQGCVNIVFHYSAYFRLLASIISWYLSLQRSVGVGRRGVLSHAGHAPGYDPTDGASGIQTKASTGAPGSQNLLPSNVGHLRARHNCVAGALCRQSAVLISLGSEIGTSILYNYFHVFFMFRVIVLKLPAVGHRHLGKLKKNPERKVNQYVWTFFM